MPVQSVPTFMTTDGKTFTDLSEAETHELSLELDSELDAIGEQLEINERTMKTFKPLFAQFIQRMGYTRTLAEQPAQEEVAEAA